jgi:hypothetical protein
VRQGTEASPTWRAAFRGCEFDGARAASGSLCSFEAALVLFGCEFAREEGEKQLLQLLLLAEITRLTLMNQQHGVCEGIAQLDFLFS